jgi:DNA repair exonuclease SbcCD nuclease subunit
MIFNHCTVFLSAGDFWHQRGSLPVTPLNLVLDQLVRWKQPTLMLVGNHDQVSPSNFEQLNAW